MLLIDNTFFKLYDVKIAKEPLTAIPKNNDLLIIWLAVTLLVRLSYGKSLANNACAATENDSHNWDVAKPS